MSALRWAGYRRDVENGCDPTLTYDAWLHPRTRMSDEQVTATLGRWAA